MSEHSLKSVMVTGAGGSIGSELVRQISKELPLEIFLIDNCELSLFNIFNELKANPELISVSIKPVLIDCSKDHFLDFFSNNNVDYIYHVAAYKHVNLSADNPLTYYYNNIIGTNICQTLAIQKKAKFVLVSTDKAVYPANIMGKSKRLSEILVLANANKAKTLNNNSIVRFGNVLNSSGSVIPIFRSQINKGGPVTVTDKNATRFFMSISEATALIVNSTNGKLKEGIFVLDMGPVINIHTLACNLIEQAGYKVSYNKPNHGEIKVEFIGLRPGEKKEEVLSYGEISQSEVSRVMIAKEYMGFSESEKEVCLDFANGKISDLPAGFSWDNGFG